MRTLLRTAPVAERLAVVRDVADRFGLTDLAARARDTVELAAGAPLGVAVVGQFKAGKSSLVDSLLGRDLLPVRVVPATSVVTTVRHGDEERVTVRFESGATVTVGPDDLADYVTEQRNPGNAKGVRLVDVRTPALDAFPDLVLVDTPGLGSVFDLATAATSDWLPHVGVALLAVPATQPLGAADLDLLARVATHTPHVLVVVTKADLVAPGDLAEVLAFVADRLATAAGRDLVVLPHSTAPDREPVRAALRAELARLQDHHAEAADAVAAHRAATLAEECRAYLLLALAAADADAAARDGLRRALAEERSQAHRVLGEALTLVRPSVDRVERAIVGSLGRRAPELARRVGAALAAELTDRRGSLAVETAWVQEWLARTLAGELGPEARAAAELAAPILREARGPLDGLSQAFVQRLDGHVRRALGVEFQPPVVSPPDPEPEPVDVVLAPVFDSHLELLSWMVPMPLVRPLVHRHFLRLVRWQVEKNALRLGYATSAAATTALRRLAADCAVAIDAQVAACERLVDATGDDGAAVRAALRELDRVGEGA